MSRATWRIPARITRRLATGDGSYIRRLELWVPAMSRAAVAIAMQTRCGYSTVTSAYPPRDAGYVCGLAVEGILSAGDDAGTMVIFLPGRGLLDRNCHDAAERDLRWCATRGH